MYLTEKEKPYITQNQPFLYEMYKTRKRKCTDEKYFSETIKTTADHIITPSEWSEQDNRRSNDRRSNERRRDPAAESPPRKEKQKAHWPQVTYIIQSLVYPLSWQHKPGRITQATPTVPRWAGTTRKAGGKSWIIKQKGEKEKDGPYSIFIYIIYRIYKQLYIAPLIYS